MTPQEALEIVRQHIGEEVVAIICRDYGSHFSLYVGPPGSDPNERTYVGLPLIVCKRTGEVIHYDDAAFLRGKEWEPVVVKDLY